VNNFLYAYVTVSIQTCYVVVNCIEGSTETYDINISTQDHVSIQSPLKT